MYHKSELIEFLKPIKPLTKCIIIYGSHSDSNRTVTDLSDIDFILIYKNHVNPYNTSVELQTFLDSKQIIVDYCWYTECCFLYLLNQKIDLFLWKSIFFEGDVIYSENDFVINVKKTINRIKIESTIAPTANYRNNKINYNIKAWARDLSRLYFDKVTIIYFDNMQIQSFEDLPLSYELVQSAYKAHIINNEQYVVYINLNNICKKSENEINSKRVRICEELSKIDAFISNFPTISKKC